jgi:zinc protease
MTTHTSLAAALFTLPLMACSAPQPPPPAPAPAPVAQSFRASRPMAAPTPDFTPPIPTKTILPNGLTLLAVEKPGLPLISLTVLIKSGAAQDPANLPGLSGFLGEMLRSGTKSRNADKIADELETRGASLMVGADQDSMTMSLTALNENFDAVFEVVADMLQNPAFTSQEIERVRHRKLAALAQERDDPARTASRVFRRVLFDTHPYGHTALGDEAALKKIGRADLEAFFKAHVRPANAAIAVVGNLTTEEAKTKVLARLGTWKGKPGTTHPPKPASDQTPVVTLVDRPGAPQSEIRVGELGLQRLHPDYFAVQMCNAILGGMFNSRVNLNLREDKGYTYGAYSSFEMWRSRGLFGVGSGVETSKTGLALVEVFKEIERMRKEDVSAEELAGAKQQYALSLPGYFENVNAIAAMATHLYLQDLPLDYYRTFAANVDEVTVADVRRVAETYLTPEALSVIVVGDAAKIDKDLTDLGRGPVVRRDASAALLKR